MTNKDSDLTQQVEQEHDHHRACTQHAQLLRKNPKNPHYWSALGQALCAAGQSQSALNCYVRALSLDKYDAHCWSNFGNALADANRLEDALEAHRIAVSFAPDDQAIRFNYALTLRDARLYEQSLRELEHCLDLQEPEDSPSSNTQEARLTWEKCLLLLHLGRYPEAWPNYDARWLIGAQTADKLPLPQWQGEPLDNCHIVVLAEQGFGDFMLAARCLSQLKQQGAYISLVCKSELHPLLGIEHCDHILDSRKFSLDEPPYHFKCSIMSLFSLCSLRIDALPVPAHFNIPQESLDKMSAIIQAQDATLRVGIAWSGNQNFSVNKKRAVNLSRFLPLAEIPGIQLYSMQKGPQTEELEQGFAASYIVDLAPYIEDFGDAAAALMNFDVLVMTDSALAHLAASLDRPVINLLAYHPYWIYSSADTHTPWYPSMILIKQAEAGDWDGVFYELNQKLLDLLDNKETKESALSEPA